jgi:hypothetical protein
MATNLSQQQKGAAMKPYLLSALIAAFIVTSYAFQQNGKSEKKSDAQQTTGVERYGGIEVKADSVQKFQGVTMMSDARGQKYLKIIVKQDDVGLLRTETGDALLVIGNGKWTAEQVEKYRLLIESDRLRNLAKELRQKAEGDDR